MQIQTKRARDTPEKNIVRDGIETQKVAVGVQNKYHIKSVKKGNSQISLGGEETGLKNLKLSRKKYVFAKGDEESPNNITTIHSTASVAAGVAQTGGVIRTAVGGTRNTAGRIQTAVRNGVKVGSVKDVGKVVCDAGTIAKNATVDAVAEGRRSMLKTKIDKTTTTDTGAEAIKQGLTDIRYVDNARKAVYNAALGGIKTSRSVKETPKAIKRDVQKIREKIIRKHRAKNVAKAQEKGHAAGVVAKKTVSFVGKVVTSKGFIVVALGGVLLLLMVTLLSSFVTMILSAMSSMFSWLTPRDGTNPYEYLELYHTRVQAIQATYQESIDAECVYTPEYRYDGTEITSLNQYGNLTLAVDENAVIAAAAVKRYELGDDVIQDDDLGEMMSHFYTYEHHIDTDYCPDHDCSKDEATELTAAAGDFYVSNTAYVASDNVYAVSFKGTTYEHTSSVWTDMTINTDDGGTITGAAYADVSGSDWEVTYNIGAEGYSHIDWNDITIKTTTIYCNNPNHNIYYGEVTNIDAEMGLADIGFCEDSQSMFWTFYGWLQEGGI